MSSEKRLSRSGLLHQFQLNHEDISQLARSTIIPFVSAHFKYVGMSGSSTSRSLSNTRHSRKNSEDKNNLSLCCLIIFNRIGKIVNQEHLREAFHKIRGHHFGTLSCPSTAQDNPSNQLHDLSEKLNKLCMSSSSNHTVCDSSAKRKYFNNETAKNLDSIHKNDNSAKIRVNSIRNRTIFVKGVTTARLKRDNLENNKQIETIFWNLNTLTPRSPN